MVSLKTALKNLSEQRRLGIGVDEGLERFGLGVRSRVRGGKSAYQAEGSG